MADQTAQNTGDTKLIFDFLGKLSLEYVDADLKLLAGSYTATRSNGVLSLPALQFSPRMSARLNFDMSVSKKKRILFGLIKKKRSERVADLAIEFGVAPTLKTSVNPLPQVKGTWPDFLVSVKGQKFHLKLINNTQLTLEFGPDGNVKNTKVVFSDGHASPFDEISQSHVAEILLTLNDWVRKDSFTGSGPLVPNAGHGYDGLISQLVNGVNRLYKQVVPVMQGASVTGRRLPPGSLPGVWKGTATEIVAQRERMLPVFGGQEVSYDFDRLQARFKVSLDEQGNLATKPFQKGSQRFDIEASLVKEDQLTALLLKLWIPDFLVSGPVFDKIFAGIKQDDALDEFIERLEKHWHPKQPPTKLELQNYLSDAQASGQATIIRTHRDRGSTDKDLFLVHGLLGKTPVKMMFSADLEFEHRDSTDEESVLKKVKNIKLNATKSGDLDWKEDERIITVILRYLHNILLSQCHWRGRFG
jgi:hypothetical protein